MDGAQHPGTGADATAWVHADLHRPPGSSAATAADVGYLAATRCSAVTTPANCSARAVDKPTIGRRFAPRASGVTGGEYACSAWTNARYGRLTVCSY